MDDTTVYVIEEPTTVTIDDGTIVTIPETNLEVVSTGIVGPPGAQGPPGPTGPPGGAFIEFDQLQASNLWVIAHNLNAYPVVNVVDSAGTPEFGDISYLDANTLNISFTNALAGKAYLLV